MSEVNIFWTPERVRALRLRLRLTLDAAASKVGVRPRTWLGWELPSQNRHPSKSHEILLTLLDAGKI